MSKNTIEQLRQSVKDREHEKVKGMSRVYSILYKRLA